MKMKPRPSARKTSGIGARKIYRQSSGSIATPPSTGPRPTARSSRYRRRPSQSRDGLLENLENRHHDERLNAAGGRALQHAAKNDHAVVFGKTADKAADGEDQQRSRPQR